MAIKARYEGRCPVCRNEINVGDVIARPKGERRYAHEGCVRLHAAGRMELHAGSAREAARGVGELSPDHIDHPENAEMVLAMHECGETEALDEWAARCGKATAGATEAEKAVALAAEDGFEVRAHGADEVIVPAKALRNLLCLMER